MNDLEVNFSEVINMIETRRNNAYRKVNEELISLYWDFGKYISEKVNDITFEGKKYYISCRGWVKDKQEAPQE